MRATLLHAFLVAQYSGALLVRRPLRPRAGAVVRTAAGSVARCEEKITAAKMKAATPKKTSAKKTAVEAERSEGRQNNGEEEKTKE